MSEKPATAAEPDRESLGGSSARDAARRYFLATRPRFYPASVLPVLVGCAWGFAQSGHAYGLVSLIALAATVCVHAASNVLNDVGDDINGSDAANMERLYPFTGGSRFIQNGVLTAAQMQRFGLGLLAFSALLGLWLVVERGPGVLIFGLTGVALAVLYSLPGAQLSGRGIGEVCIAIAFGLLPVTGAAWLQSGIVDTASILVSLPVGCWVAAILLINEIPDMRADEAAGKRTWPVRFGYGGTRFLYVALQAIAFTALLVLVVRGALPTWSLAVPLALLAVALGAASRIPAARADTGKILPAIKATLAIQTVGCLWLVVVAVVVGSG